MNFSKKIINPALLLIITFLGSLAFQTKYNPFLILLSLVETMGIEPMSKSIIQYHIQTYLILFSKIYLKDQTKSISPQLYFSINYPTDLIEDRTLITTVLDSSLGRRIKDTNQNQLVRLMQNCMHRLELQMLLLVLRLLYLQKRRFYFLHLSCVLRITNLTNGL